MIRTESAKLTRAYFMLFVMSWIISMMFFIFDCFPDAERMLGAIVFFIFSLGFAKSFLERLK